jgi:hypothetical protein
VVALLLLFLISSVSFLFGFALASFESGTEIEQNDMKLRDVFGDYWKYEAEQTKLKTAIKALPTNCEKEFPCTGQQVY